MAELPVEKIHAVRAAIARLRCAAHELDALLADFEPSVTTTAMIDPQLTDFMQKMLPDDEKQRLTEILPQLGDGAEARRSVRPKKPQRRNPRGPQQRQS